MATFLPILTQEVRTPMEQLVLQPRTTARGEVTLPGSKSLSNRILLLAALARGTTTVTNLLDSDDVRHMLTALRQLGITYQLSDDRKTCVVQGAGGVFKAADPQELFLGNAGTAVRPLTAALCISEGTFTITGEPRMYERPIGDLVDAMRGLGADVTYQQQDGYRRCGFVAKLSPAGKWLLKVMSPAST
jgi:3-phosphoshikimate 1-carboxyvinyltransferase